MTHGQVRMAATGCGCEKCEATRERRRAAERRYAKRKTMGMPGLYVDAEPVRRHVLALLAAGMNAPQIALGAGLGPGSQAIVNNIVRGQPWRGQAPARRVHTRTAQALLAVRAAPGLVVEGASCDATGTRRRLRALQADGWTLALLGERLHALPANVARLTSADRVSWRTAAKVTALYDELSATPGPSAVCRAANRRRGWLPPGWWDADTIDDPAYAPPTDVRTVNGALLFDWSLPHAPQHYRLATKGYSVAYIAELSSTAHRYVRRDIVEQRAA